MPECGDFSRYWFCRDGNECLYLHVDPESKKPPCEHYERGFCPLGPYCAARHVKKKNICRYYMAGFCPNGKGCAEGAHPIWKEKEDMKKLQVRCVLSEEEKEQENERLKARMENEKAEEERQFQERPFHYQRGRGRGRRNWNRRGRERY